MSDELPSWMKPSAENLAVIGVAGPFDQSGPAVCDETAEACMCLKPASHVDDDPVHECDCGGKWEGVYETDTFKVVAWPVGEWQ